MTFHDKAHETLEPDDLARHQRRRLAEMLAVVRASNPFYRHKLHDVSFDPLGDPLDRLPLTTRAELQRDQREHPPYGSNLTFDLDRYTRIHQTSGSSGLPLRWLDTPETWAWWEHCWGVIFRAAGVSSGDRLLFPFSFGPFVGFWGAYHGAISLGCFCLPAGGMTTVARLRYLLEHDVTMICCTPTYAMRMAEVAEAERIDLSASCVRGLIVAGEPGGNIPTTRRRIESSFGARVFDHCGMTEVGPWGFECQEAPGDLHVMESEFIAEVIDPASGEPVADGEPGELVLTNLGRIGSPLIRYRTGDRVCLSRDRCACGRWFARAKAGILGRLDDVIFVRGNNVFPSALEGIIREFGEVAEFRVEVEERGSMTRLRIVLEPCTGDDSAEPFDPTRSDLLDLCERVHNRVRDRLHFAAEIGVAKPGTLPRFDMKAKRFVRTGTTTGEG